MYYLLLSVGFELCYLHVPQEGGKMALNYTLVWCLQCTLRFVLHYEFYDLKTLFEDVFL